VWHRKLVLEYHFEERQLIQFKVFDRDSASEDLQVWDSLTRKNTSPNNLQSFLGMSPDGF
jgi:hypothetical protein